MQSVLYEFGRRQAVELGVTDVFCCSRWASFDRRARMENRREHMRVFDDVMEPGEGYRDVRFVRPARGTRIQWET